MLRCVPLGQGANCAEASISSLARCRHSLSGKNLFVLPSVQFFRLSLSLCSLHDVVNESPWLAYQSGQPLPAGEGDNTGNDKLENQKNAAKLGMTLLVGSVIALFLGETPGPECLPWFGSIGFLMGLVSFFAMLFPLNRLNSPSDLDHQAVVVLLSFCGDQGCINLPTLVICLSAVTSHTFIPMLAANAA